MLLNPLELINANPELKNIFEKKGCALGRVLKAFQNHALSGNVSAYLAFFREQLDSFKIYGDLFLNAVLFSTQAKNYTAADLFLYWYPDEASTNNLTEIERGYLRDRVFNKKMKVSREEVKELITDLLQQPDALQVSLGRSQQLFNQVVAAANSDGPANQVFHFGSSTEVDSFRARCVELTLENKRFEDALSKELEKSLKLEDLARQQESHILKLQEDLAAAKQTAAEAPALAQAALANQRVGLEQQRKAIEDLLRDTSSKKKEKSDSQVVVANQRAQIALQTKQIAQHERLIKEMRELPAENEGLRKKIQSLESQLEEAKQKLAEGLAKKDHQILILVQEKGSLESKIAMLALDSVTRKKALIDRIKVLEVDVERLKLLAEKSDERQLQIDELTKQNADLKEKLMPVVKALKEARDNMARLEAELAEAKNTIALNERSSPTKSRFHHVFFGMD